MKQEHSSAATSINSKKVPAVFKKIRFEAGWINFDNGGGRFDTASEYVSGMGATNLIFDPYNRSYEHNAMVLEAVEGGKAHTSTVANVLNVIKEREFRLEVIKRSFDALRSDGVAYFWIYEGDKSGVGKITSKGWQENRLARSYVDEIGVYFDIVKVGVNLVVASKRGEVC